MSRCNDGKRNDEKKGSPNVAEKYELTNLFNIDIEIKNWDPVFKHIHNDEGLMLPSLFLEKELQMDKWNNIPIPLVNGFESLQKSFGNVSNIIEFLIKEN